MTSAIGNEIYSQKRQQLQETSCCTIVSRCNIISCKGNNMNITMGQSIEDTHNIPCNPATDHFSNPRKSTRRTISSSSDDDEETASSTIKDDSTSNSSMDGPTVLLHQRQSVVPNFRQSAGLKNVYRCSAPDNLVDVIHSDYLLEDERFILYEATLLVDLRSTSEIDEEKGRDLMKFAPGGEFVELNTVEAVATSKSKRQLLRLKDCALTRSGVMEYVAKHWIPPETLKAAGTCPTEKRRLIFSAFNEKGLKGLVEVILETKAFIAGVLKAMTIHLEQQTDGKVIFHCNIGKDRAGVLAMLCASMLGVGDQDIIDDFAKSFCVRSLAEQVFIEIFQGQADPVRFAHASPETMVHTLNYLRQKYGSIEKYLDSAGFDETWRTRFIHVAS